MKTELDLKMKLEVATFKIALSVAIKNEEMVECSQTRLRNEVIIIMILTWYLSSSKNFRSSNHFASLPCSENVRLRDLKNWVLGVSVMKGFVVRAPWIFWKINFSLGKAAFKKPSPDPKGVAFNQFGIKIVEFMKDKYNVDHVL